MTTPPGRPTGAALQITDPVTPVLSRIRAVWIDERRFDVGRPDGTTVRVDAWAGPGPVEVLLGAVATCSAIDVVDILAKRRTPVERLQMDVTAERRPEPPRRVQRMAIEFHVDGAGIEGEQAERAIQLSFEKYCSVAASLAPDIVVETRLVLNGERFDAVRRKVWTG